MSLWKKILLGFGALVLALVVSFVTVIGPWPVYSSGFEGTRYFNKALAAIDDNVTESAITTTPGRLQAGWGKAIITPEIGTPLAGYGDRKGAPSTGVHDDLYVKALALSDGQDTVVIVGADILLVPPNVADLVREQVGAETPLTPNDLYFGASHTHCSLGAFGPGIAAYVTGGKYDPSIPGFLAKQFSSAIIEAYERLEPAKLAKGGVDASKYIRNRTRKAPVDGELSYLVAEQDDGDRCYLVSFSAHPTVLGGSNRMFTAEYPGFCQHFIEGQTGAMAVYLGGALGSMGHGAPEAPDRFSRSRALGEALGKLVLDNTQELEFRDSLDVVSLGVPLDLPPFQVRVVSPKWRFSKYVASLVAGIPTDAWMQGARVGDIVFVGVPADFSGEISADWKKWAEEQKYDLWTSSFSAAYAGYISPDKYYDEVAGEYETGLMSWCGPHQEAYFTALMKRIVSAMAPA